MSDTELDAQDFEHRFRTSADEDPFAADPTKFVGFRELFRNQPGWMRIEDFHWIAYRGDKCPFFYRTAKVALHRQEGYDVEVRNHGIAYALFPSQSVFLERMNADGAAQHVDDLAPRGGICDLPVISFRDEQL